MRRNVRIPVTGMHMETKIGQVTNPEDVDDAVKGCDYIIHIAANTNQHSTRYADYYEVNVRATEYVLDAAKRYGITKTIIVSSANAFGYGSPEAPGNEQLPMRYPFTKTAYAKSKKEAQDIALAYPKAGMGSIVVVNPTFMIGKYDGKPSSGKIITMNYRKRFNFIPPGGKNFVHVEDVARGIHQALLEGKDRQCYLLSGENMSYKAFYKKMQEIGAYRSYSLPLPKTLLLFMGAVGTCMQKIGISTSMHYYNMRILCVRNYYSNAKARSTLNLSSTPVSKAISDAISWFHQQGMLKSGKIK